VGALNAVDGPLGLWTGSTRTLTATILDDTTDTFLAQLPGGAPNRCNVSGQIYIHSLFAKIFGNFGQNINTFSSAAMLPIKTLGSPLILLVSNVDQDPSGKVLKNLTFGSTFTVQIKTDSLWIANPDNTDKTIINNIADPANAVPVTLPPMSIGDYIKVDNGLKSAGQLFDSLKGHTIFFAVTNDSANNPVLGQGQPVHQIIGFMGLYVTGDTTKNPNPSLTGTLVSAGIVNGLPSGSSPGSTLGPFLVRLIQ
jgi:hypothetical protein